MKKLIVAAALTIGALTAVGSAHAASLSYVDLGTPGSAGPLLGTGVTLSAVNNAAIVTGGGVNDGSIVYGGQYTAITGTSSLTAPATYTDGSTGWNPFGVGVASTWLSIGGQTGASLITGANAKDPFATFDLSSNTLEFVWGSPSGGNTVSLYAGADGNGLLLGTVSADGNNDLTVTSYGQNGAVAATTYMADFSNVSSAGEVIKISSDVAFKSAVLSTTTGNGGFEVGAVSAVPLPAALPLFGSALLGLGAFARKRARNGKTA